MAIRAGESWGGAEGVAAAKWPPPTQALCSLTSFGKLVQLKTWDSVAHRPRGHVLLSWPRVRGEDSVLAECTPRPASGLECISCCPPLLASASQPALSPSCRSGGWRGECATCFGFHQPFQIDSQPKCQRFSTYALLLKNSSNPISSNDNFHEH